MTTHAERIRLQLAHGPVGARQLLENMGISQPTLSQQLGVLRNEGLVATRRDGKWVYYRIASPEAMAILGTLHQIFCETP